MQLDKEFVTSLVILGAIIMGGVAVIMCLVIAGIALRNRLTRKKIIKELYEKKERENGQSKSGARGEW